jgi:hypothetical protein
MNISCVLHASALFMPAETAPLTIRLKGTADSLDLGASRNVVPMYQYNDGLTQLFTKYKCICLWLQCFDPLLGHHQAYIIT